MFEFGAGHSSAWYGRHAGRVVSVDDSAAWLKKVRPLVGSNVELLHRVSKTGTDLSAEGDSAYAGALTEYPPGSFDIIVVDGKERVACAQTAPSRLRDGGLIIFDNSDKPKFKPGLGLDFLHAHEFGRIDFSGPVAQVGTFNCTSVFAKNWERWVQNVPVVFQGW